jgi:enolase
MKIKSLSAHSIPDSRGEKTIEVSINGQKASSPSGKSTGKYETPTYRKSLKQSIKDINSLDLSNLDINSFSDLIKVESLIKKQFRLSDPKKLGANSLIALEIAILKALAKEKSLPLFKIINPNSRKLPKPLGNAIGGGLHSHNKNAPTFQEFLIIPNAKKHNLQLMATTHKKLKSILKSKSMNDEGAWNTSLSEEQILQILKKFKNIKIGIDVAASSFYKNNLYHYKNKSCTPKFQIHYINSLIKKFKPYYIEDPLQEEDFKGFAQIKKSPSTLITGDDLTATQIPRLKKAIRSKSINAMIIKPNQNGSLLELQEIFKICKTHKIKTILSHRSGETLDTALADLAVGFQADFIKTGIATPYRKNKLSRLLQIEKSLK